MTETHSKERGIETDKLTQQSDDQLSLIYSDLEDDIIQMQN